MIFGCRHKYEEYLRTEIKPIDMEELRQYLSVCSDNFISFDEETIDLLVLGQTTILFQCQNCSSQRTQRLRGTTVGE